MCRLFGFRSVLDSQVHQSLVSADNALMLQSSLHPDGWGVAYYREGVPHVIRSMTRAIDCQLFRKVSGIVSSETVLAHLRKATIGDQGVVNTHPFQYGPWTFAHNGNLKNFKNIRSSLLQYCSPELRTFILGDTDSELVFYMILSQIYARQKKSRATVPELMAESTKEVCRLVAGAAGPMFRDDAGPPTENYLTFILTDGKNMIAHQGGKSLYFSTHKVSCSERDTCPWFAPVCESPVRRGKVNHLIFSSEPLKGENVWNPMDFGSSVVIDAGMNMSWF